MPITPPGPPHHQFNLFTPTGPRPSIQLRPPLAYSARPQKLAEFVGMEKLLKRYPFLNQTPLPSMIFYGPPGSGKTTLAHLVATASDYELYPFSAVLGGVNDLKKLIQSAQEMQQFNLQKIAIFIDEIHRFNKAQQDALLPYVESGSFLLLGATTENPRTVINPALQSRLQLLQLPPLNTQEIKQVIQESCQRQTISLSSEIGELVANYGNGDARRALNIVELLHQHQACQDLEIARQLIVENARQYDRTGNRHYDLVSALIKSMRGSDPNCALLYLAVMLDGGEDPVFIARRLVILASEDIGNADPFALVLATSALQVVSNIGMPEARITLAQIVTYLACAPKSNAAYRGISAALEYVQSRPAIQVPEHLKNYPAPGTPKYQYPHDYPPGTKLQDYSPEKDLPNFYSPAGP